MTKTVNVRLTLAKYNQLVRFLDTFNERAKWYGGISEIEQLARIIKRANRCKNRRKGAT